MIKRTKVVAALIVGAVFLSSCENTPSSTSLEITNNTTISETTTAITEESTTAVITTMTEDTTIESSELTELTEIDTSAYDEFIAGNQTADISSYADYPCYSVFDDFDELGTDCSLNDILNKASENFELSAPQTDAKVYYSYIDCGRDGIPELLVNSTGTEADGTSLYMVFKDFEGQIKLCYAFITWSRCTININQYGYLSEYGSSGAFTHNFRDGYIDANGEYNLTTEIIYEGMIDVINSYSGLEVLGDKLIDSNAWDDGLYIEGFRFSEDDPYYVTFRFIDDIEPYDNVYSEGNYYDIFTTSDVLFVLPEKQKEMIAENYSSKQFDDEFMQFEELEWQELK